MTMTATEVIELVAEMRRAQKAYFKIRRENPGMYAIVALQESQRLERAVDRALDEILRQPTFFGGKE